eukprot:8259878-Ditylum_brightwellii.AAC.1
MAHYRGEHCVKENLIHVDPIDILQQVDFIIFRFESCQGVCSGHVTVYMWEAMKYGAYAWAAVPGSNPGQSAHFSGGEEEVAHR